MTDYIQNETEQHSPATQYRAASESAALFDVDRTTIQLRGKDRLAFLHNFCTNDIKRLGPGEGCEAFLTNIKGRILGHIIVSATEDALWLDSEPGTAEFIVSHLDKYIITEDVQLTNRSCDFVTLLLVGPQSEAWLKEHVDGFTPLLLWSLASLPKPTPPASDDRGGDSFKGSRMMIRRVAFTAPPAFELLVPAADVGQFRQFILDTGIMPASIEVFEALRIEAGFPRYGVDLTDDNIAQEAGRTAQAISFTKGCYLGQEPIARLDALGHTNKELRRLELSSGPVPSPGTPVLTSSGDQVGQITSAAMNPVTGRPVALAMLKTSSAEAGAEVVVDGARAVPAELL